MMFWHISGGMEFHSSTNLFHKSCAPFGEVSYLWSCHLICSHRCSMGLRSGDCAGHGRTSILLSSNHCVAFHDVCLGSLLLGDALLSFYMLLRLMNNKEVKPPVLAFGTEQVQLLKFDSLVILVSSSSLCSSSRTLRMPIARYCLRLSNCRVRTLEFSVKS